MKLNNAAAVSLSEVLDGSRTLFIEGDAKDKVQLTRTDFQAAGTETVNGKRYDVYTSSAVKLYIDDEINSVTLI